MKVALVHDDLVQWGGAEKVLLELTKIFPNAPIYTSVIDWSNPFISKNFKNTKVLTSFMQKIPGWKILYKGLLPLYPIAFEQFNFDDYDLVISQTTRFAKAIITKPKTIHVCLCHTPPRFLWNLPSDKTTKLLSLFLSYLRIYDVLSARRVDYWIAGSINCKLRLKKIYQVDSEVIQPFCDDQLTQITPPFEGDYYLLIARLNSYKRVDIAIEAFNSFKKKLVVVGTGSQFGKLKKQALNNISFYSGISDYHLAYLLAGCKGVVITAEEDFGMTALEAQAFGKGVIAYGQGGSLETVIDGKTGILYKAQTAESLMQGIESFEQSQIQGIDCRINAERFSRIQFRHKLKKFIQKVADSNLD